MAHYDSTSERANDFDSLAPGAEDNGTGPPRIAFMCVCIVCVRVCVCIVCIVFVCVCPCPCDCVSVCALCICTLHVCTYVDMEGHLHMHAHAQPCMHTIACRLWGGERTLAGTSRCRV